MLEVVVGALWPHFVHVLLTSPAGLGLHPSAGVVGGETDHAPLHSRAPIWSEALNDYAPLPYILKAIMLATRRQPWGAS